MDAEMMMHLTQIFRERTICSVLQKRLSMPIYKKATVRYIGIFDYLTMTNCTNIRVHFKIVKYTEFRKKLMQLNF